MASQDLLQYFDICSNGQYETSFEDLFYPIPSSFLIAYVIKAIQDLKKKIVKALKQGSAFNRHVYTFGL